MRHTHEGISDALPSRPFSDRERPDIAASGNPHSELPRHRSVIVQPKLAVGLPRVVVVGTHRPRARRKNKPGTHHCQRTAKDLPRREGIRAYHQARSTPRRLRNAEAITNRVEFESEIQFINLAMVENDFATRTNQHRCVEQHLPRSLDQPGTHENSMLLCRTAMALGCFAVGNGSCQCACRGMRPPAIQCLRQQHKISALLGSRCDAQFRTSEIIFHLARQNEHLRKHEIDGFAHDNAPLTETLLQHYTQVPYRRRTRHSPVQPGLVFAKGGTSQKFVATIVSEVLTYELSILTWRSVQRKGLAVLAVANRRRDATDFRG